MKNPEKFTFNPEETPEEFIESLRQTEAGQEMEKMPAPSPESLKEDGEKARVGWENRLNGNTGYTEYMPREKAERWMEMIKEEYPDEEFWRHWIEIEEESLKN